MSDATEVLPSIQRELSAKIFPLSGAVFGLGFSHFARVEYLVKLTSASHRLSSRSTQGKVLVPLTLQKSNGTTFQKNVPSNIKFHRIPSELLTGERHCFGAVSPPPSFPISDPYGE